MNIAIDARMYGTAQRGIGRYLMKLIEQLEIVDKENQYTIFLRKENFEEYQPKNPNFKKALWDVTWYGIKEQITRSTFHVPRSTLFHFPHWNVPFFFNRPFIVTIHDLELFSSNRTRENSTRGRFVYWFKFQAFKIIFRHAVLAARAIIVPSNVVCEQLLDKYPQVRKNVVVIYEAPTIEGLGTRALGTSKLPNSNPYSLIPSPYALYVGAAYPHKNLTRLLEAWQMVHKELPEYKLVLVGREDFFWKRLKQEWSHNPSQPPLTLRGGDGGDPPLKVRGGRGSYENVIFYGSATDSELAGLYENAALLVQPSLEEGFSLSPLEALSFGTPVAVSDIPVHREILNDAASFFNPLDISSIVKTMTRAFTDPTIKEEQIRCSRNVLLGYSWKTHAQQTKAIYTSIASQDRGNSVK